MLRINKIFPIFLLVMAVISCIRSFDPVIESDEETKYVVSGCVTDEEGYQSIYISTSSPVENPENTPLSGCTLSIIDGNGREFAAEEMEPGKYSTWMEEEDLLPGISYHVVVNTPSGDVLTSDPDTMPAGPHLDSLYYLLEEHLTANPSVLDEGIQFYIDLKAEQSQSRYYRWEVMETWEYHTPHAKEFYYDGDWHQIYPPDSSTMVCYSSNTVQNIFTLTTRNLVENAYRQFPLHFVNGKSPRLGILYSVLVSQYALSEAAYLYWDQLKENTYDQGGLYEKQPMDIKGNVHLTSGNAQEVLGYFYVASVRSKRMFIQNVEGLELDFPNYCGEEGLGHFGWAEFGPKDYPVYYYLPATGGLLILSRECVECERLGGSLIKPDFWPY
jgi:hypothetical protein